jgi:hypothetical protein
MGLLEKSNPPVTVQSYLVDFRFVCEIELRMGAAWLKALGASGDSPLPDFCGNTFKGGIRSQRKESSYKPREGRYKVLLMYARDGEATPALNTQAGTPICPSIGKSSTCHSIF